MQIELTQENKTKILFCDKIIINKEYCNRSDKFVVSSIVLEEVEDDVVYRYKLPATEHSVEYQGKNWSFSITTWETITKEIPHTVCRID